MTDRNLNHGIPCVKYTSDSMFYPLTLCALQIVFMIMIISQRTSFLQLI